MQTFITRMAMAILHFSPLTRILCLAHWQILLRFTRMETDQRRYLSCRNISSIDASSSTRFADFHCDATVRRKIVNMRLRMVCGRFYNSFVVRGWLGLELRAGELLRGSRSDFDDAWRPIPTGSFYSILFLRRFANISLTQGN